MFKHGDSVKVHRDFKGYKYEGYTGKITAIMPESQCRYKKDPIRYNVTFWKDKRNIVHQTLCRESEMEVVGNKEVLKTAVEALKATGVPVVRTPEKVDSAPPESSVDDILAGLQEDIQANSKDKMLQLKESIEKYREQERRLAYLADKTKEQKEIYNRLSQSVIPELMKECGLEDMTLSGGAKLKINSDCNVTVKDEAEFFKYLERRNEADIIKNTMTITKPSKELVKLIKDAIAKEDRESEEPIDTDYEVCRKINTNTLKAYCKREVARTDLPEGKEKFPPESISVFSYKKTKIKG